MMSNEPAHDTRGLGGVDEERLAALMDGRLSESDRAALLSQVASSDEALSLLADAAAALGEVGVANEQETARTTTAPTRLRAWYRRSSVWVALAAGVVGVAVIQWARRDGGGVNSDDPGRFVRELQLSAGTGLDVTRSHSWSQVRGVEQMPTTVAAVRIGAYVTDVQLAIGQASSGADSATTRIVAELTRVLDQTPGGALAAQAYRAVPIDSMRSKPAAIEAARAAASAIDPDFVDLGAWGEAALVASRNRDAAFFERAEGRQLLQRVLVGGRISDATRAIVSRVAGDVNARTTSTGWTQLRSDVVEMMRAIGD